MGPGLRLPFQLRLADVRALALEDPAALISVPYRSLLHLRGWHEKRIVFERGSAALRPGGRFAFNVFAFDHVIAASLDGTTREQNGIVQTFRYARADNRLRWANRSEWEGLLDVLAGGGRLPSERAGSEARGDVRAARMARAKRAKRET